LHTTEKEAVDHKVDQLRVKHKKL